MIILLRNLPKAPYVWRMCLPSIALSSGLVKVMATLLGTYVHHPLQFIVLFVLFVDYLGLASFLWWLNGDTTARSPPQVQLRCALYCTYGVAAVMLFMAILGAVMDCWLLFLQVNTDLWRGKSHFLPSILTLAAPVNHYCYLDKPIAFRCANCWKTHVPAGWPSHRQINLSEFLPFVISSQVPTQLPKHPSLPQDGTNLGCSQCKTITAIKRSRPWPTPQYEGPKWPPWLRTVANIGKNTRSFQQGQLFSIPASRVSSVILVTLDTLCG